jgi:hypothetical protein
MSQHDRDILAAAPPLTFFRDRRTGRFGIGGIATVHMRHHLTQGAYEKTQKAFMFPNTERATADAAWNNCAAGLAAYRQQQPQQVAVPRGKTFTKKRPAPSVQQPAAVAAICVTRATVVVVVAEAAPKPRDVATSPSPAKKQKCTVEGIVVAPPLSAPPTAAAAFAPPPPPSPPPPAFRVKKRVKRTVETELLALANRFVVGSTTSVRLRVTHRTGWREPNLNEDFFQPVSTAFDLPCAVETCEVVSTSDCAPQWRVCVRPCANDDADSAASSSSSSSVCAMRYHVPDGARIVRACDIATTWGTHRHALTASDTFEFRTTAPLTSLDAIEHARPTLFRCTPWEASSVRDPLHLVAYELVDTK